MSLYSLNAISPIDGRYQSKTKELNCYYSEAALIKYRVRVEVEYFISLCKLPLPQLEKFDAKVKITSNYNEILNSDKIVLHGVGAFGNAINKLKSDKSPTSIASNQIKAVLSE